jgi:WXG100 family type VII secretion target
MANLTHGMNVDQVENLGRQLKGKANEIDGLTNAINGLVDQLQTTWKGHDASEFKGWWDSQHRPALQRLREAIDGLGQSALHNASEQRQVSGH